MRRTQFLSIPFFFALAGCQECTPAQVTVPAEPTVLQQPKTEEVQEAEPTPVAEDPHIAVPESDRIINLWEQTEDKERTARCFGDRCDESGRRLPAKGKAGD